MGLPRLPSLSDLDLESDLEEYKDESVKKKKVSRVSESSPKVSPTEKAKSAKSVKKTEKTKPAQKTEVKESGKPKIPKSQYDAHGKPELAIPDLNDVDLSKEIDRFFD